jgi:hypothetical protein
MAFMTKIDNTQDVTLAMETAGHDFEVEKLQLQARKTSGQYGCLIPDYVSVFKKNSTDYLGTVGKGWELVQPKTIYDLADELIKSTNGHINGVFDMWGSSVIGISFKLAEREYVSNDNTELNFIMMTSFNGKYGIAGHATTYRLISDSHCNTSAKVYNLKHTKNVANRLEVVKNMLKYYQNEIAKFDERMTTLVEHRMNDNAAVEWFKSLFPKPKSERAENILKNQVSVFIDLLHNGKGSDIPGVRGTCYGGFQALTEYINHYRSIKVHNGRGADEVRFQSVHFGSGNTLIQSGLGSISGAFSEFSEEEFKLE